MTDEKAFLFYFIYFLKITDRRWESYFYPEVCATAAGGFALFHLINKDIFF